MIGKYERGEAIPSIDAAKKIADALVISLDYLVGTTEEILDKATLNRIQEVNKLSQKEKELVNEFLDAFITKSKIKTAIQ